MKSKHVYENDPNSEHFVSLCLKLNSTQCKANASWFAEVFSGGFMFNDEIPDDIHTPELREFSLSMNALLRRLWAYRMSLVEGKPRCNLAATWELTRALAPQWAGFAPDRCSPKMQSVVDDVRSELEQYDQDIERVERRIEGSRRGDGTGSGAED